MDVTLQNAAMAYGKAVNRGGDAAPVGGDEIAGGQAGSFADLVKSAGEQAQMAMERSETMAVGSAGGANVELTDIVQAVNNAEIALQTVTAVRDRVIDAYQQIIRMPI